MGENGVHEDLSESKYFKVEILRGLITEKMTKAVREILAVVETAVAGYDNEVLLLKRELDHHKRQLDAILQPQVNLYRIDFNGGISHTTSVSKGENGISAQQLTENSDFGASGICTQGVVVASKVSHEKTQLEHEERVWTLADLPSDFSVSCLTNREDKVRDNTINEVQNTKPKRRRLPRRYRSNDNDTEWKSNTNQKHRSSNVKKKHQIKLLITLFENSPGRRENNVFRPKSPIQTILCQQNELKDTCDTQTTACDNRSTTSVLEETQPTKTGGPSKTTVEHANMSSMDSAAQSEDCEDDNDWKSERCNKDEQHCGTSKKKIRKKRREQKQKVSSESCDTCKVCGHLFRYKTILTKHALSHLDNPKGICGVCGQQLESSNDLKSHLETHQKLHQCGTCGCIFLTFVAFQRHIVKCQDVKTAWDKTLQKKKEIDCKDKPFKCDICPQSYSFKTLFEAHYRKHTGEKPYCCDVCGKSLKDYRNLCRHKLIHTGEKNYSCKQCGKLFYCTYYLKEHQKIHSIREKIYLCEICCKTFHTKQQLTSHQKIHRETVYIKCPICDKLLKGNLDQHMIVHTGQKRYNCNECGKKFRSSSHLKNHMDTHLDIKPFTCTVCGYTCRRKAHLNVHMSTHTGLKPYKCKLCDKAFTQSHSLKTHMKSHQTEEQSAAGSLA